MKRTTLQNSIIRTVGRDNLIDIMNHGADAGFPGISYYSDTCEFYRRHRNDINRLAIEMADDLGEEVIKMVAGFRCLNNDFTTTEVAQVMFGRWDDNSDAHTMIANALTWFAAEEVARQIEDN